MLSSDLKSPKHPQHLGSPADFLGEGKEVSWEEDGDLKNFLENCKVVSVSIMHRRRSVLATL